MKTNKFFAALMMGFAVVACQPKAEAPAEEGAAETPATEEVAQEEAPKEMTIKDYTPSRKEIKDVSYLIGVNFGSFIKGYNFGDVNFCQMIKGIKDFVKAKGNPRDEDFGEQFKINPEQMNDIFNEYLEKRHNLTLLQNKEKEAKFLEANATKEGVQTTESGLQYKIIEAGNEVKPAVTDTVWVKYEGKLLDGTVFDKTEEDGDPIKMNLNRVVKGWQEGLQLIGEGGKIELYIPAALGYGEGGTQGIEPNSTLIFNVELTKVGKFVEPAEETK